MDSPLLGRMSPCDQFVFTVESSHALEPLAQPGRQHRLMEVVVRFQVMYRCAQKLIVRKLQITLAQAAHDADGRLQAITNHNETIHQRQSGHLGGFRLF